MKKTIKMSGLLALLVILSACGDSGSSTKSDPKALLKKSARVNNLSAEIEFNQQSRTKQLHKKIKNKFYKLQEATDIMPCEKSGTSQGYYDDDEEKWYAIKYDDCIQKNEDDNNSLFTLNGIVALNNIPEIDEDTLMYTYINFTYTSKGNSLSMKKLTDYEYSKGSETFFYSHGDMTAKINGIKYTQMYNQYVFIATKNGDIHTTGDYEYKSKCFSEKYSFKMDDKTWLIPHDTKTDYFKSGTIVIDGIKYVYEDNKVTLSEDGKSETYEQQEVLDAEAEKEKEKEDKKSSCSI